MWVVSVSEALRMKAPLPPHEELPPHLGACSIVRAGLLHDLHLSSVVGKAPLGSKRSTVPGAPEGTTWLHPWRASAGGTHGSSFPCRRSQNDIAGATSCP